MSDIEETAGGPAPEGVTEGDDTGPGTDETTAAAVDAASAHPVDEVATEAEEIPEAEQAPEPDDPRLPVDDPLLRSIVEPVASAVWESSRGQDVVQVSRDELTALARLAKDVGFDVCVDVTAVDWYRSRADRYDVVINLLSHRHVRRLRIIVPVPREDPTVPSVTPLWPGANYAEREAYDMFGIVFDGHPDLTRILMPDDWVGYPLRKDEGTGAVPVQFKESHKVT
jgi:NADH/F420H2 dehydrogenase subunit C